MANYPYDDIDSLAKKEHQRHIANVNRIITKAKILKIKGKISQYEYNQIAEKLNYKELNEAGLNQYIENLLHYRYGLIDIYSRVIQAYGKYETGYIKQDSFPDFTLEMEEFFKYIGCYDLYKRMKDRGRIIKDPNASLNTCINGGKTSYIVLKEPFENHVKPKTTTIVHEMGHTYFYYVTANYNESVFARDINCEIVSLFFERLFLDFLLKTTNNQELIKIIIRNFETNNLRLTRESKNLLEVFDDPLSEYSLSGATVRYTENGKEKKKDLYDQTYAVGNLGAARLFIDYGNEPELVIRYFEDFIRSILALDFQFSLLEHNDIAPLEKYLENSLTLKLERKDT